MSLSSVFVELLVRSAKCNVPLESGYVKLALLRLLATMGFVYSAKLLMTVASHANR